MTELAIAASIDALATRIADIDGIMRVYTVTGTAQDNGQLFPIPPSFDSRGAVCNLWFRGTTFIRPGNVEEIAWRVDANVWAPGAEGGYAYRTLMPFADRFIVRFRGNDPIHLGVPEVVTKCVVDGIGEIVPQSINNGQIYLVLPITFALLNHYESSDYTG